MGKLHTLRRAIERNPKEWMHENYCRKVVMSAKKTKTGQWVPFLGWCSKKSYRSFVKHVLKELGYDVDQGR